MLAGSASNFDAVLFHIRNMEFKEPKQVPLERNLSQRYVMFLDESPSNNWFPYQSFGNFFNWYNLLMLFHMTFFYFTFFFRSVILLITLCNTNALS